MKQAEVDIARLEKEVDQSAYWADHAMRTDQLESAREKYRSLKYEYTIQSSVLILVVFVTIAIATSYLLGGV
tara:strand:- start:450 stop:665 length:216 start_codon:yes stop_codon:yes gene_type:complete